jgi:hypothetical protein
LSLPIGDTTGVAAVAAAATGFVAAAAGITNLVLAIRRDLPSLAVFTRRWATGPAGSEQYIEVVVANISQRPISVVDMGLKLTEGDRTWRESEGATVPTLPAKLEDGETVRMTWLRDELGREFHDGKAVITGCFAVDGRNKEVTRREEPGAPAPRAQRRS